MTIWHVILIIGGVLDAVGIFAMGTTDRKENR